MPGFREFAVEIRKRDTDYRDVTVDHIAFYGRQVEDPKGVFRNKIVERDNTNQQLSDFQAQNVILSEDPSEGLIILSPQDERGNTEAKLGHWSNIDGKAQLDLRYGSGRVDEDYNIRLVNNDDHKLVIKTSGPELESYVNIESNVRVRKGHVSIEDTESFVLADTSGSSAAPISGADSYRQANGVNLEWNWGREDIILSDRGFTESTSAGWQMDLFSDKDVINGENQWRFTDKSSGETIVSARQGGSILIGHDVDGIDDDLSRDYELLVYDDFYVNNTATISGNTEIGGTLYVEEYATHTDSIQLSGLETLSVASSSADGYNVEFNFGQRSTEMASNGFTNPGQCDWQIDAYSYTGAVNGENQLRISDKYEDETHVSLRKGGRVLVGQSVDSIDDYGFDLQVYDTLYVNGITHHNDDVHMIDGDIIFTAETSGTVGSQNSDGIIWNSSSDYAKMVFEEVSTDVSQLVLEFGDNASTPGNESFKIAFIDTSAPSVRNVVFDINSGGLTLSSGTNVNEFSTDVTLGGASPSDDVVPTELALKTYIDEIASPKTFKVSDGDSINVQAIHDPQVILCDTNTLGCDVILPLNPIVGQLVTIKDIGNSASTAPITIGDAGPIGLKKRIDRSPSLVNNIDLASYQIIYTDISVDGLSGSWWII